MVRDDFAIFILANGRPDRLFTVDTLKRKGYTGKYYIILDDEDKTIDGYKKKFGEEHVVIFSKTEALKKFDIMDNFPERNVIVFARNVCNDIARSLGIKYFAEFEDDYKDFAYRVPDKQVLRAVAVPHSFDDIVNAFVEFVENVSASQPHFRTIAFAQSGEMLGGTHGSVWIARVKRKAMNTFFFKVPDNPEDDVKFIGRMNDDVNTYMNDGKTGGIWMQISDINCNQLLTQQNKGGNTESYKKYGTYVKTFYSVMAHPSAVKVAILDTPGVKRVHHAINYNYAVPKILNEKWKKS